ncbi:MAG: hypothetical protein R3F34_02755 [Planctomycetota bacterium]
MDDPLRKLALTDGRYAYEAYRFLMEGLDEAINATGRAEKQGPERHVTGREVLDGLVARALRTFGPLGARVWRSWGVVEPLDWGRIVFLMVENGMLNRRDSDSIDDFRQELDLGAVFEDGYTIELPDRI